MVDNGSTDDTLEIVRSICPDARVIETGENLGYGKAINIGFRETSGEFAILSNPDIVFLPGSIAGLIDYLKENRRVGVVGPQQMFPNRSWQRSYGDLPGIWSGLKDAVGFTSIHSGMRRLFWPKKLDRKPKNVPYVDGGVLAVRREAFEKIGGFDEDFFFYGDESDLCARMRLAGWRTVFNPEPQVIHARGADSARVDASDHFVRHMVTSQSKLAKRYLSPNHARLYMQLQRIHFERLALAYRVLRMLSAGHGATNANNKIRVFRTYSRVLHEYLHVGSVLRSS